jgi:hypothetical protein
MPLWLAIYQDNIGADSAICSQNNGAIPHSARGLDTFGEVNFAGLGVGHCATSD